MKKLFGALRYGALVGFLALGVLIMEIRRKLTLGNAS